jgi:hypothetical protein
VLTEKLNDIEVRLEQTPRKSLKRLAKETGVKSSTRTARQLLKSSSESWCLVCCKCKKDCCTCFFNETTNYKKNLHAERTAFSTPHVICELLTTSFRTLSAVRHADLLVKLTCSRGKQRADRRETQGRDLINGAKIFPV